MKIAIRRARTAQADLLTDIAHAAKRHWGYPESHILLWKRQLTVDRTFISDHRVFLGVAEDVVVGFYAITGTGEEQELEHFWVRPEFMSRGIGRRLYAHALRTAREGGARALKIVSDPNAEGFYLRMGARRAGEERSVPRGRVLPVLRALVGKQ